MRKLTYIFSTPCLSLSKSQQVVVQLLDIYHDVKRQWIRNDCCHSLGSRKLLTCGQQSRLLEDERCWPDKYVVFYSTPLWVLVSCLQIMYLSYCSLPTVDGCKRHGHQRGSVLKLLGGSITFGSTVELQVCQARAR